MFGSPGSGVKMEKEMARKLSTMSAASLVVRLCLTFVFLVFPSFTAGVSAQGVKFRTGESYFEQHMRKQWLQTEQMLQRSKLGLGSEAQKLETIRRNLRMLRSAIDGQQVRRQMRGIEDLQQFSLEDFRRWLSSTSRKQLRGQRNWAEDERNDVAVRRVLESQTNDDGTGSDASPPGSAVAPAPSPSSSPSSSSSPSASPSASASSVPSPSPSLSSSLSPSPTPAPLETFSATSAEKNTSAPAAAQLNSSGSSSSSSSSSGSSSSGSSSSGSSSGGSSSGGSSSGGSSSSSAALQAPPLDSGPTIADINMTWFRWDSIDAPRSVDWRSSNLLTDVLDQGVCESCWVLSATDLVSIMWALVTGQSKVTPLSPEQSCTCGHQTCCDGGWPEWVFQFIIVNGGVVPNEVFPYTGTDDGTCLDTPASQLVAQMTGWERVPSRSVVQLMKAVAQHPVLAFISASSLPFLRYRSGIFSEWCSTDINHAVLVVGYEVPEDGLPFWILKNAWGPDWGEGGYMRLLMTEGKGHCGLLYESPIYPTFYPNPQSDALRTLITAGASSVNVALPPASEPSFVPAVNPCQLNPPPCGAGTCSEVDGAPRCSCPSGFVERLEVPMPKCVSATPCASNPNPCGLGTCSDEFDGSYSCKCSSGSVIGSRADGGVTCVVGSYQSGTPTYTTVEGDTCERIALLSSITPELLEFFNPFLDCSAAIPSEMVLIVANSTSTLGCQSIDVVEPADSCASVALRNKISTKTLLGLNKGLNCSSLRRSQKLCVLSGQISSTNFMSRACGRTYDVKGGDTCRDIQQAFNISADDFSWLNSGVSCEKSTPLPSSLTVCVAPLTSQMLAVECRTWYSVKQGDTCPRIWNANGMTETAFFSLNPGLRCTWPFFQVGQLVCVEGRKSQESPLLRQGVFPYVVKPGDSPQSIVASYSARCNMTVQKFCDVNTLPDCTSQSLTVGQTVIVPCDRSIRAIDCPMCSDWSGPVCGFDQLTYPNQGCLACQFGMKFADGYCQCSWCSTRPGQAVPATQPLCQRVVGAICRYPQYPPDANMLRLSSAKSLCEYFRNTCTATCDVYNVDKDTARFKACWCACYRSAYPSPCGLMPTDVCPGTLTNCGSCSY